MKLHFIGIGGIGVSALAKYYLEKGYQISGSDLKESEITKELEERGAKIFIGKHTISNIINQKSKSQKGKNQNYVLPDLVIYSPAIQSNNPELKEAKKRKIKCLSYPQALGELTKEHFTIACCGTHGKSTTSSMIGFILEKAGLDPTIIVGTKMKNFQNSNFKIGKSKYLVIEADEYQGSFLNYFPKIVVLTSLDWDHPDYFKTEKDYFSIFKKFVKKIQKDGFLILNGDDKNISNLKSQNSKLKIKILEYSLRDKEAEKVRKILKIPGEFNVSNALAAIKCTKILKIPEKISLSALSEFLGCWRRSDSKKFKISKKEIEIIDDYAHHPKEVLETSLALFEKFKRKKVLLIFQPHQFQRTFYLFDDFVKVFQKIPFEKIWILDIFSVAGREKKSIKKKVSSKKLVSAINRDNVIYVPKDSFFKKLQREFLNFDVLIFMGAGDIYDESLKFKKFLESLKS
jgi:UDP-N-acetylmuramate--alanine ligase